MAKSPAHIDIRRTLAVAAGKATIFASRRLGRGGGNALPGLVATRLDPAIVRELAQQIPGGSVVVSGTNGKTTTCRMLATILTSTGARPLRNSAGSNLMRGLASALVQHANLLGNVPADGHVLGLFEVDEATLPAALGAIEPATLLLLDLFRDQLDRYGEVATVARIWAEALVRLPPASCVVANADDPLVADVASRRSAAMYFGIRGASETVTLPDHASDVKACPRCGGRIDYSLVTFGHLGTYACTVCDFRRPAPTLEAETVRPHGMAGSEFELIAGRVTAHVSLPLPGIYNVYNALGAAAAALALGIGLEEIARALGTVTPAFGRMERVRVEGHDLFLALAKNPAGLNEILRTLTQSGETLHLLVMLNDNIADGRDVSWIWDADVEMLQGRVSTAVFAGTRAEDMALRFKYAGVTPEESSGWAIEGDTEQALRKALALTPPQQHLFIVPTYTALLDVRNTLTRLGYAAPYWEE